MTLEQIQSIVQLGPVALLSILLVFNDKKAKKLADILAEQMEDKDAQRKWQEEQNAKTNGMIERLYAMIEKHASALQQSSDVIAAQWKLMESLQNSPRRRR